MDKKKRILVVEDDMLTAYWLTSELTNMGYYTYESVTTGESAVEFAVLNKPDFILMDIWLSGKLNGIEAAEKILSSCNTYIIFMSGYPESTFLEMNKKINFEAYLTKPLQIYDLENTLQRVNNLKNC